MRDSLFHIEKRQATTLQNQIRARLVEAMLNGQMPAGSPIPSTRAMAKRLKVSRNTVMLAYQALAADGYLVARERSGFYVSPDILDGMAAVPRTSGPKPDRQAAGADAGGIDWPARLAMRPGAQANIEKPRNWHDQPYPFIYGQVDESLFPIADWRACVRQAMSRQWLDAWTDDRFTEDDPMLVEQFRQRVLTRRGILAGDDEVLVTLGAQNALYLLARLLISKGMAVAVEDPGYPDMRNICRLLEADLRPVPVDAEGICVDRLADAKLVYVTPSHHYPTNATMSLARRHALLAWAEARDAVIIEDDYESETNYRGEPVAALKSLDRSGRVLYVGSLSKSLMPGLRMGFLVAPPALTRELRALRRLIYRHPPGNNQRVTALFLALGHHDAMIARLHKVYAERWQVMDRALKDRFPGWAAGPGFGGTSFWLQGPEGFDARRLAVAALEEGVVIEPGDIHFADPDANQGAGRRFFRLGFSSIPAERIARGIDVLRRIAS